MSDFKLKDFLKTTAAAAVGAYVANKFSSTRNTKELWSFQCHNSKCGHYEERSGNHQFKRPKCPSCDWKMRGKKI